MKQSFDARRGSARRGRARRGFLKTATVAGLALSGPARALAAAVPDPWKAAAGIAQRLANPVKFRKADYVVTDFGAAPCKLVPVKAWVSFEDQADLPAPAPGAKDCYAAIKAAIEKCHAEGGGRVVIPKGDWFCAGPIVERISPLGLLITGACCSAGGLLFLSGTQTVVAVFAALTIYGVGKTFMWPTMLAVASERYPKGGAVVIGAMGGVGMLSAGLLGGPGIGYNQDRAASDQLKAVAPAVYEQYKAPEPNHFLFFREITGLDGSKVNPLREKPTLSADEQAVHDADLHGGRTALKVTALLPTTMAILLLGIIIYFKATGGYRALHVSGEEETGGVEGPMEA